MPRWTQDPERFAQRPQSDGELVICLNGILTHPGNQWGWTDNAERWLDLHTRHDADSVEFWQTPILGRLLGEGRYLREASALLSGYFGAWSIAPKLHLVAHSRGCDIARRLITEQRWPVRTLHLFSAAIDADFETNGLADALRRNLLGEIICYASTGDAVLKWIAGASCGLYGRLGYTGPQNIPKNLVHRVKIVPRNSYGHSTWFDAQHLHETMELVELALDHLP